MSAETALLAKFFFIDDSMKATIWTSWGDVKKDHDNAKPRCIFIGELLFIPTAGDLIVVRDGFFSETVKSVTYSIPKNEIEISIVSGDANHEYGDCLYR